MEINQLVEFNIFSFQVSKFSKNMLSKGKIPKNIDETSNKYAKYALITFELSIHLSIKEDVFFVYSAHAHSRKKFIFIGKNAYSH